jgi:aspartate aminotransferase/aromatic-amino-acid transaminase
MGAFRTDPRANKIDLGVGVYKDESGNTPVMTAVSKAEARLLISQTTKVYEGPKGNPDFCAIIESLVLGRDCPAIAEGRITSYATPGGCGALYLSAGVIKRMSIGRVWVSRPTWPNHINLLNFFNLEVMEYAYHDAVSGKLDFEALLRSLETSRSGDAILIQGPCHNPTGADLSHHQWEELGRQCRKRGLFPLVDCAYHGLADGIEEDMRGIRTFIDAVNEALIAYSCSKNFGLYRERTGCVLALGASIDAVNAVSSQIASLTRSSYSMPPAHGPAIVSTILSDPELQEEWAQELSLMRKRISNLRNALAAEMLQRSDLECFRQMKLQRGMFSQLPLTLGQTKELVEQHAIYVPNSGRINLAGLLSHQIAPVVEALCLVMQCQDD